jgi:hypothetical protein
MCSSIQKAFKRLVSLATYNGEPVGQGAPALEALSVVSHGKGMAKGSCYTHGMNFQLYASGFFSACQGERTTGPSRLLRS